MILFAAPDKKALCAAFAGAVDMLFAFFSALHCVDAGSESRYCFERTNDDKTNAVSNCRRRWKRRQVDG